MKKTFSVILAVLMLALCCAPVFAECEHEYSVQVVAPKCAEQGYTLHVCGKCGDNYKDNFTDVLNHNYGSWTTVNEATCTSEGLETRTCIRCGGAETKTIPVLPHTDANSDGKCDACGASVEVVNTFAPFDWLMAFFRAVAEWFRAIFA